MGWFSAPNSGADSSPTGWSADGTLLNGGGWALNSWDSHKRYTYEWPPSSSPETAQVMKSYRDGTYGRGLLYFIEPAVYKTNVLPARWASPQMAVGDEAPPLVPNTTPTGIVTSGAALMGLPVTSAQYDLSTDPPQTGATTLPDPGRSVFIPIPEGYTLHLGAYYSATGSAGVFAIPVDENGNGGTRVQLTPQANNSTSLVTESFTGGRGVRLFLARTGGAASTLTLAAMIGRLVKIGKPVPNSGPWIGGQGHSGCRFSGTPSYVTNSGVEGGRIGFAASFIEVGSWTA